MGKILLDCLEGNIEKTPMWMMRQAGRHLPEYREVRKEAGDFLSLCYTPKLATEVTLQPIRRYGMDGAILFADILLVLDAMKLGVRFETGIGPIIEQVSPDTPVPKFSMKKSMEHLSPVFETVSNVRAKLPEETTLIGFAGAPWTVGLYAIEGRGKTDKTLAKMWAYQHPKALEHLLETISEITLEYLVAQVEAGANALMLFDSWAADLPLSVFEQVIIKPTQKLIANLRQRGVDVPIVGFPKGAGQHLPDYIAKTGISGVGLDTATNPNWVQKTLPQHIPIQGHLDPLALMAGGARLDDAVDEIMTAYKDRPHIFNLGHGVLPTTPIPHVEQVVARVRNFKP